MHKEILTQSQIELLPLLQEFSKDYYLAGGTAIALYIGHRRSIDYDLFSNKDIHRIRLKKRMEAKGFHIEQILYEAFDQIHLLVGSVKLTFFCFPYKISAPNRLENIISMPTLLDLAAMKAFSLGGRAKWKDYIDLYFLFKNYFSLKQVTDRADQIFGTEFNEKLFREQLSYYEDMDYSEKVDFVVDSVSTSDVKAFLTEIALSPFD